MALIRGVLAEPLAVQLWVLWLFAANAAAVFFLQQKTARWVLAALVANCLVEGVLAETFGYDVRLLGLSHIAFWTPLVIYLSWQERKVGTAYRAWRASVFASVALSLAIDYVNAARLVLSG